MDKAHEDFELCEVHLPELEMETVKEEKKEKQDKEEPAKEEDETRLHKTILMEKMTEAGLLPLVDGPYDSTGSIHFAHGTDFETADIPNMRTAFLHYAASLQCGHAAAAVKVGEFFVLGYNTVRIDWVYAKLLFTWAYYQKSDLKAAVWLARLALSAGTGRGGKFETRESKTNTFKEANKKEATGWLTVALQRRYPAALFLAAHAGTFQEQIAEWSNEDRKKAKQVMQSEMTAGFPDSCFFYAVFVADLNAKKGEWADWPCVWKAVPVGHAEAQWWVSRCGWLKGVPFPLKTQSSSEMPDEEDVVTLRCINALTTAALQNHPFAMADLSTVHLRSPSTFAKGHEWAKKAAKAGATNGFWNVGVCLWLGWGCTKNTTAAIEFFTTAAEHGHAGALAKIYLTAA